MLSIRFRPIMLKPNSGQSRPSLRATWSSGLYWTSITFGGRFTTSWLTFRRLEICPALSS